MTVAELLAHARHELALAHFDPPRREAGLLLGAALGWSEAQVLARPDSAVPEPVARRFAALLERRLTGEPVAYLLGRREFFGRSFLVDSRVLIPRPESEHLVEAVLDLDLPTAPRILDVATGSGCLAVTLASELTDAHIVATDVSLAALAVARQNRQHHAEGDRVSLVAGDLASALDLEPFDVVVCNPPYVDPREASAVSPQVVEFEPRVAVFAPDHGTSLIQRLLDTLARLPASAWLVLEIGYDQAELVTDLVADSAFVLHALRPDLAGIPRVLVAQRR